MNGKIGLLDSGIGGLSILKELIKVLPNEDYLFYEDSLNNPYGYKDDDELYSIVSNNISYLINNDCKVIVLACNTATISCIDKLREDFKDIFFIGVVPAIKDACFLGYKNILVLSTKYTSNSQYLRQLIINNSSNQNIIVVDGGNLANLIEKDDILAIRELLHDRLDVYSNSIDAVVLGCTHYSLIKDEIEKIFPNTYLLDSSKEVSQSVYNLLQSHNLLNLSLKKGKIIIENNLDDSMVKRSIDILER